MILVELFSKHDCELCDLAKSVILKVQQEIPFQFREIKLIPGEGNFEEFKEDFPVVHINKRFAFKHRLNEQLLKIRLQQSANEKSIRTLDDDPDLDRTM